MRRVRLFVNREKICDACGHTLADVVSLSEKEVGELESELWEILSAAWRTPQLRALYETLTGEPAPAIDEQDL